MIAARWQCWSIIPISVNSIPPEGSNHCHKYARLGSFPGAGYTTFAPIGAQVPALSLGHVYP